MTAPRTTLAWALAWWLFSGCGASPSPPQTERTATLAPQPPPTPTPSNQEEPPPCAPYGSTSPPLPGVTAAHRRADYWIARNRSWPDTVLSRTQRDAHNRRLAATRPPEALPPLHVPMDAAAVTRLLVQRLERMNDRIAHKALIPVPQVPQAQVPTDPTRFSIAPPRDRAVAQSPKRIQIRCIPLDGSLFAPDSGNAFDKNACSAIAPFEPFVVMGTWGAHWWVVRTDYAVGWVPKAKFHAFTAPRDTPIPAPTHVLASDAAVHCPGGDYGVPRLTAVAVAGDAVAHVAGTCRLAGSADLTPIPEHMTRTNLLRTAFSLLGTAYGWGGQDGGRDCSRFIMDVFAANGVVLPRTSGEQADAGSFYVDVSRLPTQRKLEMLDAAHSAGIVLLYLPGHIMLYLGRDEGGTPMAIHALGEYARPCPNGGEQVLRVRRVVVSNLDLGAGSSRRSLAERITRLVVFAPAVPQSLAPLAHTAAIPFPTLPPAGACTDSTRAAIFASPRRPLVGRPARVMAVTSAPAGPHRIQIWTPDGTALDPETAVVTQVPGGYVARFVPQSPGTYTAVLGSGSDLVACDAVRVVRALPRPQPPAPDAPYWPVRWTWEADTENLFSLFVAHLFATDGDLATTWRGLGPLLDDPQRNLLFNHLGRGEDGRWRLFPDCADLPYALRAYFAWKLRLPFGIHACSRGRAGRPPSCGTWRTNLEPVDLPPEQAADPAAVFARFAEVVVGWTAHSASARTPPRSDETDFYPVAIERRSLAPGAVFADPWGHILVVAGWQPQTDGPGALIAVDAQPDGTIGVRRFWEGTFLFDPDTTSFGAGFKRFRPVLFDRRGFAQASRAADADAPVQPAQFLSLADNAMLRSSRQFARYSTMQYRMSRRDFYDAVFSLINPDPLDLRTRIADMVAALHELAQRRVTAVANGEAFMAQRDFAPIPMPEGPQIFLTEGPWEDFATPSRDMRLLVAIDAVRDIPDAVVRDPARFGVAPDRARAAAAQARRALRAALAAASFTYTNSAGVDVSLTLADLVDRVEALETAYNPNDCPEIRWGAPPGSAEAATCNRRAPEEQRARMESYRPWFRERTRPVSR